MSVWGCLLLGATVLATLALWFSPLRIRLRGSAKVDPSLSWAAAGAIAVGPLALSAAAARGVSLRWHVHVFRWKLLSRVRERRVTDAGPRRTLSERWDSLLQTWEQAKTVQARWTSVVDPAELAFFLFDETRHVRIDHLTLTGGFGADDVTVTGTITGYAYVLDALLGPRVHIDPHPDFTGPAPITLDLDGMLRVFPALVAFDTLRFVLRRVRKKSLARAVFSRPARQIP